MPPCAPCMTCTREPCARCTVAAWGGATLPSWNPSFVHMRAATSNGYWTHIHPCDTGIWSWSQSIVRCFALPHGSANQIGSKCEGGGPVGACNTPTAPPLQRPPCPLLSLPRPRARAARGGGERAACTCKPINSLVLVF